MGSYARLEYYFEERVARYLELAEAAQEAAGRAVSVHLQETYARLAEQWLRLADLARSTLDLSLTVSAPPTRERHDPHDVPVD